MTAKTAPSPYVSGFCGTGGHDRCQGVYAGCACACDCHQVVAEPEPETRVLRIGSLFSGYGGLEHAVQAVLGGTVAWHSEIDPGACKILAHRHPDVPNLGDITAVDWSAVEPVDVLTGGSPCQDVSAAGKRLGMRAGTRSGLWASMCDAIDIIRPGLVVWENVRGVLSAGADSAVEPCPICVGDERDSHLRALGRVVGDLAELGYVGRWTGLRAADVGAPHGRFRVFVTAWPAADASCLRSERRREHGDVAGSARAGEADRSERGRHGDAADDRGAVAADSDRPARCERWLAAPGQAEGGRARSDAGRRGGAPAADAQVINGWSRCDDGSTEWQQGHDEPRRRLAATRAGLVEVDQLIGPELDASLLGDRVEVGRPVARDEVQPDRGQSAADCGFDILGGSVGLAGGNDGVGGHGDHSPGPADGVNSRPKTLVDWGEYAAAVARWEQRTREAPPPTEPGAKGQPRLSPAFVEWLMGLPAGWVTEVPRLGRNEQLKALGNGVVPQQAAAALRMLLLAVTPPDTPATITVRGLVATT